MHRTTPVLLAVAALAATAGTAHADAIAYVKDGNVWLANPDGSGQHQVTLDGTAEQPYRSPSQADDGTIAAGKGHEIVRLKQNGEVLGRMDPPPLTNSVSHPVDGPPVDIAISPDGAKIAYTLVNVSCPIAGPECGARPATAITPSDRMAPQGNSYTSQSSWVTNDRVLTFAGYLHQVNTFDAGQPQDVHWFDDQEVFGQEGSTDQSDGEVNRQGTYVATIRGYGADRQVMWLKVTGDVARGSREAGTLGVPDAATGCLTGKLTDLSGPTWSPSGTSLAWREDGAIHVWDDVRSCDGSSRVAIPGGTEPDWGPADIDPGPRPQAGGPQPQPSQQQPPPTTTTKAKLTLPAGKAPRLRTALSKGLTVRLTGLPAGKRQVLARAKGKTVAQGTATVRAGQAATVRLRFTKAAKRALRGRQQVTLVLSAAGARTTVTLKR